MHINGDIVTNTGLARVNVTVLEDQVNLNIAKEVIKIPAKKEPHKKLENMKVVIGPVIML